MMRTTRGILDIPNDPTPWVVVQPNDDKTWCVLWLQGRPAGIADYLADMQYVAKQSQVTVAMLDYAGHGEHVVAMELATPARQLVEVIAAYDQLRAEGYENIVAYGTSFGGYMTALLSARRDLFALILDAPAILDDAGFNKAYKDNVIMADNERKYRYRSGITPQSDNAALAAIKEFSGSVYVIEHEYDRLIPKNVPKSYFSVAQRGNYLVVPKTEHSPMSMPEPERHSSYIDCLVLSIIRLLQLETRLCY